MECAPPLKGEKFLMKITPRLSRMLSGLAACLLLLGVCVTALTYFHSKAFVHAAGPTATVNHYQYVFPDGGIYVYDMDNNQALVKHINLPIFKGGRGCVVDPASNSLYLSYNGDGGSHGTGSLLKYNLLNDTVVWTKNYTFGIDSMAITPDGKTIYMPDGEASYDGTWRILSASDGSVLGSIFTATGDAAHNTVVSLNGKHVYLGALNSKYLYMVDTSTNKIIKNIGPLATGVRPFTINGTETLAYTTATGFLGFEVSSITTGKLLYHVPIKGFASSTAAEVSHGITLSPNEKEVYVIDTANSYAHVFDVSGVPATAPVQVADIPLRKMSGTESPCLYDCTHEGWILHSIDGRFVYVGDSGDVIDTATRKVVNNLDPLFNTRKYLEIDFSNGNAISTSSRHGLGYVTGGGGTPTPTSTTTATPSPTSTTAVTPSPTSTLTPTPNPGTTIAQDTFQRANQTHWGTASDGHAWAADANTQNAFSIVSNQGQISNGNTYYNAVLGATASNAEVLLSGSISSFTNANMGAVLRWKDTNNWYKAYISGANLVIQAKVNGTYRTIGSTTFNATAGQSYTIRFRAVSSGFYAKAWTSGTTEPTVWMATGTDTALQTGYCGVRVQLQSGVAAQISSFIATTAS